MKKLEQRVPNLRFKGFTDDWEQRKLGDVVNFFSGLTYHPSDVKNKGYFVIRSSNIQNNQIVSADDIFVNKDIINVPNVKQGDIIVVVRNGSRKLIGKHAQVLTDMPNTVIGAFMTGVRSKSNFYINALLDSDQFQKEIYKNLGATINQITIGEFRKMRFIITSGNEAQTIGEFFKKIDTLITLQQRKLDLLKQLKKGFLQKMFAEKNSKQPVLRFKGFHDDWEGRKLENSADYIRGSFPQPYGNKEWYGGTNAKPFVQVVDVNTNMRLNKKTKEQISVLAQPKSRFVPSDSIVVTLQGSIGRVAITQYDSYVDRTLLIFTKYKVPVDKYFWAYSIQNIFRIEKQKAPGGTIKTITKRALSSFEVSLPVQEEQKKIGTLLKNIDDIITSQQEEVSKLKKIKKSLLQQMFI